MTGMLKEECYNDSTRIIPMLDANEKVTQDLSMSGLSVKFRFFGITGIIFLLKHLADWASKYKLCFLFYAKT